jgi:hypothetical protein
MADDVEVSLWELWVSNKFFLQVDESTLSANEASLLAYDRFLKKKKLNKRCFLQEI